MTGVALASPKRQFLDPNGVPLAGGFVEVYEAGTTALVNTWQDRDLTILNTNPIELDAGGFATIWVDPSKTYKEVVRARGFPDPDQGAVQYIQDNMSGSAGLEVLGDVTEAGDAAVAEIEAGKDAALVDITAGKDVALGEIVTEKNDSLVEMGLLVQEAEAAVDVASNIAGTYPDTATAIADAGLVDGKYFTVPSTLQGGFLQLYRKSGGVALPGKTSVSSDNFTDVNSDPNVATATVDDSEEWASEITTPTGTKRLASADITTATVGALTSATVTTTGLATLASYSSTRKLIPTDDIGLLDEVTAQVDESEEWASMGTLADGRVHIGSLMLGALQMLGAMSVPSATISAVSADRLNGISADAVVAGANPLHPNLIADVCHFMSYGQSLDLGTQSLPSLSTTQPYDSLMFNGGMRPTDGGSLRTALVPAVEADFGGIWGETPMSGMAYAVKSLLASENGGPAIRLLLSADGEGGKKISELLPGSTYYTRLEASVAAGMALSNAGGYTYNVPVVPYIQGENDASAGTSSDDYAVAVEGLRQSMQATVKAVTAQANSVWLFTGQTASHEAYVVAPNIPIAQYRANKTYPYIRACVPQYIMPHAVIDNIHLTNVSSRKLGYYMGLFYKRIVIDRKDFKPVQPRKVTRQGDIILVEFDVPTLPSGALGELQFKTTLVTANTNQGFRVKTAALVPIAITSVTITNKNFIRIVAPGVTAGCFLDYALEGSGIGTSGPVSGPRGNLCDNYGATVTINGVAMDNYCLAFRETL